MDYSPEQPTAGPPLPDADPLTSLADSYRRQADAARAMARSTRLRERAKTGAIVVLAAGLVVSLIRIDGRAARANDSSQRTLAIAQGFQCQQAASTGAHLPGCPPLRPGAASNAGQTQSLVDQIVWRIQVGIARGAGLPIPPRPADVPPSVAP